MVDYEKVIDKLSMSNGDPLNDESGLFSRSMLMLLGHVGEFVWLVG